MSDRALDRHHQRSLGAHADLDEFACVHEMFSMIAVIPGHAHPRVNAPESRLSDVLSIPGSRFARPGMTTIAYFFAAAARSTKVLPPFILWASGASLI